MQAIRLASGRNRRREGPIKLPACGNGAISPVNQSFQWRIACGTLYGGQLDPEPPGIQR